VAQNRELPTLFSACLDAIDSFCVLATESFDASSGVHQLLFAGEKWVAIGADFQVDVALMRRSGGKRVPASAHNAHVVVSGMNFLFHLTAFLCYQPGHTEPLREFSGKIQV